MTVAASAQLAPTLSLSICDIPYADVSVREGGDPEETHVSGRVIPDRKFTHTLQYLNVGHDASKANKHTYVVLTFGKESDIPPCYLDIDASMISQNSFQKLKAVNAWFRYQENPNVSGPNFETRYQLNVNMDQEFSGTSFNCEFLNSIYQIDKIRKKTQVPSACFAPREPGLNIVASLRNLPEPRTPGAPERLTWSSSSPRNPNNVYQ